MLSATEVFDDGADVELRTIFCPDIGRLGGYVLNHQHADVVKLS